MATQTAGRVFQLATRFVGTSGGMAVRLTTPLLRDSAGLVQFTHGSCGSLKSEQTAKPIDCPSVRRATKTNASPVRNALLQHLIDADLSPIPPKQPGTLSQTAPPRLSQRQKWSQATDEKCQRNAMQAPTETHTAERAIAPTDDQPTHKHTHPHDDSLTNRCKNEPHPGPLLQSERRGVVGDPPPKR